MLKSFIGADMRLYERFGVGLHNNPYFEKFKLTFGLITTHRYPWTYNVIQKRHECTTDSLDFYGAIRTGM